MIEWLRELLPANRIAAIAGFVGSAVAALAALQTSFVPGSPAEEAIAKAIAFLGAVGAGILVVNKFLSGAQAWDELQQSQGTPSPFVELTKDQLDEVPPGTLEGEDVEGKGPAGQVVVE